MERTEAIEVIRENWPDASFIQLREALETLIPELKESEDERIRKFLVKHVSEWIGCIEHDLRVSPKDVESEKELAMFKAGLAYLKKQKEQKPAQTETEKQYVRTLKALVSDFIRDRNPEDVPYYQGIFDWLDGRHIEQQPAEWKPLPESMEALLLAIEGKWDAIKPTGYMSRRLEDLYDGLVNTFDVDEKYLSNLPKTEYTEKDIEEIKALKEKIDSSMETKPAEWREEDEKHINSIFNDFKQNVIPDEEDQEWLKNRFKSLRPQPKQEWSEEDKKTLNAIISVLKEIKSQPLKRLEDWDGYINFLETLRPSWKPSEEQIYSLGTVVNGMEESDFGVSKNLRDLYEQLKKL